MERKKYWISLNCRYSVELNMNYSDNFVDDDFVEEILVDIIYDEENDEGLDNPIKIGYMELHFYNLNYALNSGYSFFQVFDRSLNTTEIGEAIIDPGNGIKEAIKIQVGDTFNNNILVVQNFGIYPEYRNRRIGEKTLRGLIKRYEGKVGYVVVKSFPEQLSSKYKAGSEHAISLSCKFINDEQSLLGVELLEKIETVAQRALNHFYERCGFSKIKGSENIYILNSDPV